MQDLFALSLLVLACSYLLVRWLPRAWRQKIHALLVKRNPKLAQGWVKTEQHCQSSCSSSCGACPSTKPLLPKSDKAPF